MLGMADHVFDGLGLFLKSETNLFLSLTAIAIAVALYWKARDGNLEPRIRVGLLYGHLAALIFPLVLLGFSLSCDDPNPGCAVAITQGVLGGIPIAIGLSIFAGMVIVPKLFLIGNLQVKGAIEKFAKREAGIIGIPEPTIHAIDSQKPVAFSFFSRTPRIFLSVGLMELLTKKEKEVVILHELAHLKRKASWFKVSSWIASVFSPFGAAGFRSALSAEESFADNYAVARQRTTKFLESAKRKV